MILSANPIVTQAEPIKTLRAECEKHPLIEVAQMYHLDKYFVCMSGVLHIVEIY